LEFVDITFIGKLQAPEKLVQVLEEELPYKREREISRNLGVVVK
jgi:hypothetical protein